MFEAVQFRYNYICAKMHLLRFSKNSVLSLFLYIYAVMYIYMHTHLHVYLWICVHVYTFKRKMLLYKGPVIFCYIMGSISTLSITPVQICLILMFWLLFFSLFPCFPPFTNQMCHAKDFLYPYCQNGASVSFAANTK